MKTFSCGALAASMLALAACAHSVDGISQEPADATYTSAKEPLDIAKCLQQTFPGLDLEFAADDISVSSRNQFGAIIMNWMIVQTPTGSTIELRKANSVAGGAEKATTCF